MRSLTPLIFVALAGVCGCAHTSAPVADHYYRTISFPRVALSEGERIESVEVVITCARFMAINRIPNDWSAEVVSPVSEISTFKATAGHGTASLWSSRDFDGFITIMVCEPSCFTISATMVAFIGEQERTISFMQSDLVMKTPPHTAVEPASPFRSRGGWEPAVRSPSRSVPVLLIRSARQRTEL